MLARAWHLEGAALPQSMASLPSLSVPPLSLPARFLIRSQAFCPLSSNPCCQIVFKCNVEGLWAVLPGVRGSSRRQWVTKAAGNEEGNDGVPIIPKARRRLKKPAKEVETTVASTLAQLKPAEVLNAEEVASSSAETEIAKPKSRRRNTKRTGSSKEVEVNGQLVASKTDSGTERDDEPVQPECSNRGDESVEIKDFKPNGRSRTGGRRAKKTVDTEALDSAVQKVESQDIKSDAESLSVLEGEEGKSSAFRRGTRSRKKPAKAEDQEVVLNGSASSSESGDTVEGLHTGWEVHDRPLSLSGISTLEILDGFEVGGDSQEQSSTSGSSLSSKAEAEFEGLQSGPPKRKKRIRRKNADKALGVAEVAPSETEEADNVTASALDRNGDEVRLSLAERRLHGADLVAGLRVPEAKGVETGTFDEQELGKGDTTKDIDDLSEESRGNTEVDLVDKGTTETPGSSGVEVKTKRRKRVKKKPEVVAGSEKGPFSVEDDAIQEELREGSRSLELINDRVKEGVNSREYRQHVGDAGPGPDVHQMDQVEISLVDESLASAESEEVTPIVGDDGGLRMILKPNKRTRRKRSQSSREKKGATIRGEGVQSLDGKVIAINVDTLSTTKNGTTVDSLQLGNLEEIAGVETGATGGNISSSEVTISSNKVPAPDWGPKWWEEIEANLRGSTATEGLRDSIPVEQGSELLPPGLFQVKGSEAGGEPEKREDQDRRHDESRPKEKGSAKGSATGALDSGSIAKHWPDTVTRVGKDREKFLLSENLTQELRDDWLRRKMRRMVLPREEPWLLESMILARQQEAQAHQEKEMPDTEIAETAPAISIETSLISKPLDTQVVELRKEPDMEVEILINSPECTMQRMAILENRKLVEFLIEPVNTKVQVGNVYLGRVKQLLPGMSGVFVDIGGSRIALLDISRNQYPYTFPPIFVPERREHRPHNGSTNGALLQDGDSDPDDEGEEGYEVDLLGEGDDYVEEEENGVSAEVRSEMVKKHKMRSGHEVENAAADGLEPEDHEEEEVEDEDEIEQEKPSSSTGWRTSEPGGITVNFGRKFSKWRKVEEGMTIIVQVKKESMGKKGPRLTAFPSLAGRFWVLVPRGKTVGVSSRITGPERQRLKRIAKAVQPQDFAITVRTEAVGHQREELEKDLARLMETWKEVMERAAAAALAVGSGEEGAVPVLLHREMGQTLTTVRDFFTDKVSRLVVDSLQSYQEVMTYLQEVAPRLTSRVELYTGKAPIFDAFNVEAELEKFSNKRVKLPNGGYLVMEETEALVSIDVNGGTGMLGHSTRQREAILDVNLAAARQIATEVRLRDIGGIIVVDFIDMDNSSDEKLVHDEMRKAIQRDRSKVAISEISEFGLMEMIRKRVRPSVTLTISDSCSTCKGTGQVEALETTLSKVERAIKRLLVERPVRGEVTAGDKWPQVLLRIEPSMFEYLKSWKRKRITQLSNALKVWISLKVAMELSRGQFQVIEIPRSQGVRNAIGVPGGPQFKLQQQKDASSPLLGKRVSPKRRRFFSK